MTLLALACCALPTEAQQEADGDAFVKRLGETLKRTPKEVSIKKEGEADPAAAKAPQAKSDGAKSDADEYWEDSEEPEEPKDGGDGLGKDLQIVSATYGGLGVDRIRYPTAIKARTFALEGAAALGEMGVPVVMEQRERYVLILSGPEVKQAKDARRLLQAAWKHTPGKGSPKVAMAYLPHVGEVKSYVATSSLDAIQFDQLVSVLRDFPGKVQIYSKEAHRAWWVALDPNLADQFSAYVNEFTGIKAWRNP